MRKKILTFLSVIVSVIFLSLSASAATYMLGDINIDGIITASDARTVLRISASLEKCNELQKRIADADKSGQITASDARLILRVSANLAESLGSFNEGESFPETDSDTSTAITTETSSDAHEENSSKPPEVPSIPHAPETTTRAETTTKTEATTQTETTTQAEATTQEETTKEPVYVAPAEKSVVPFENFPSQIKSLLFGIFGMTGKTEKSTVGTPKYEPFELKMNTNNIKLLLPEYECSLLVKTSNDNFTSKSNAYIISDKNKTYISTEDASKINSDFKKITSGLKINFAMQNPLSVTATFKTVTENKTDYGVYSITQPSGRMDIYTIGGKIERIYLYTDSVIQPVKYFVDEFTQNITDSDFSLDGYTAATTLTQIF